MHTIGIKSLYATFLALLFSVTLAGCNTIEGAGQDIQKAGGAIEEEAREHK